MGSENIIHVLVIEDNEKWQKDISEAIEDYADMGGTKARITSATSSIDAKKGARCHQFHGISIDQNLPREKGGNPVTADEGMELIRGLEEFDPPGYMSVYTAFPGPTYANIVGRQAGIPYIIKSAQSSPDKDGQLRMDADAYGQHFVKSILETYIPRVLRLVEQSGFDNLRELARATRQDYEKLAKANFVVDDLAQNFFVEFSKFREEFARTLAAFTLGLVSSTNQVGAPNDHTKAGAVEQWLRKTWTNAEDLGGQKPNMKAIRDFFLLEGAQDFGDHFLAPNDRLRRLRNDITHNGKRFTADDFSQYRGDMFRVMDLASLIMRCKFAVQLHRERDNYLAFRDVNWTHMRAGDMFYAGNVPEAQPTDVFAILPGLDRPIRFQRGIKAVRQTENGQPRLAVNFAE